MQRWNRDVEIEPPNRCRSCGAHVTTEFRRTHGDADGLVHSCPECDEHHNLARTAAGYEARRRFGGASE